MKHLRCIKYELKNLKSPDVSKGVSNMDPSVLRELRDYIGAAISAADETKATMDEVKEASADAEDVASEAQGDAIDSVQSSKADRVSGLSTVLQKP
jgi:hypothetical protein